MTKPVTLGEIRIFDDGDGVIDPAKDKITGLKDEKPIPADAFSTDLRIQATLEKLGLAGLEGVSLEKASRYFSQKMTATERAVLRAEMVDQHKQEVGKRAADKAAGRYQDWLRENGPELRRREEVAMEAADKAAARQQAYDARYGIDTDATQKIVGTHFKMDGDIEDYFDRFDPKQRYRILEVMTWIQPAPDKKITNRILVEIIKQVAESQRYLSPVELESVIAKVLSTKRS